jgi:hypothetical protein
MVTSTLVRGILHISAFPTERTDGEKPCLDGLGESRILFLDTVVSLTLAIITNHFCHHFKNDGRSSRQNGLRKRVLLVFSN